MYNANTLTTGGYISAEVILAITICLLGSGDALDVGVIFDMHSDHCVRLMYDLLFHWIIHPNIGNFGMLKYLLDEEVMAKVSKGFIDRSGGLLKG